MALRPGSAALPPAVRRGGPARRWSPRPDSSCRANRRTPRPDAVPRGSRRPPRSAERSRAPEHRHVLARGRSRRSRCAGRASIRFPRGRSWPSNSISSSSQPAPTPSPSSPTATGCQRPWRRTTGRGIVTMYTYVMAFSRVVTVSIVAATVTNVSVNSLSIPNGFSPEQDPDVNPAGRATWSARAIPVYAQRLRRLRDLHRLADVVEDHAPSAPAAIPLTCGSTDEVRTRESDRCENAHFRYLARFTTWSVMSMIQPGAKPTARRTAPRNGCDAGEHRGTDRLGVVVAGLGG